MSQPASRNSTSSQEAWEAQDAQAGHIGERHQRRDDAQGAVADGDRWPEHRPHAEQVQDRRRRPSIGGGLGVAPSYSEGCGGGSVVLRSDLRITARGPRAAQSARPPDATPHRDEAPRASRAGGRVGRIAAARTPPGPPARPMPTRGRGERSARRPRGACGSRPPAAGTSLGRASRGRGPVWRVPSGSSC